jgi:predicted N-acyltransferase
MTIPDAPAARLDVTLVEGLSKVSRADWDAVANPPGAPFDPFLSWDYLEALEASNCVGPRTGWAPRHLLCRDADGRLVGAAPAYLKSHSRGEYVFDHAFADAYERAGGRWYPKLTVAVPFTPVPGRRLLAAPGPAGDPVRDALGRALEALAGRAGLATAQVNFPDAAALETLVAQGWLPREDRQFHFHNPGHRDFQDFLATLTAEKRKNLRKERARAQAGLEIVRLTGDALTPAHWDAFFACYLDTGDRKWGSPYLNRAFFALVHERMADKVVLVLARDAAAGTNARWIAAALNFVGDEALYGRLWGRLEDRPFLHFELCYHQAIDEALARGLPRVEAGAQGAHKLARGYVPCSVWSANWIADPGFRAAVADYLERERAHVAADSAELSAHAPFRHSDRSAVKS